MDDDHDDTRNHDKNDNDPGTISRTYADKNDTFFSRRAHHDNRHASLPHSHIVDFVPPLDY